MINVQSVKMVTLNPASFTNGATASQVVDRLGFDYVTFFIQMGTAGTTVAPSALKLQSSDTTATTSFVDVPNSSFTSAYTASNTSAQDNLMIGVAMQASPRYLKLVIVPTTTQIVAATAVLSRPNVSPINPTGYGTVIAPIFLSAGA